jgi:hypothetical protein
MENSCKVLDELKIKREINHKKVNKIERKLVFNEEYKNFV